MTSGLARRIAFTLGALLVFRIGSFIPLPGINPGVWEQFFPAASGGVLGVTAMLSGGAIARLSILSLSVVPYVSAAIIVQLASFVVPPLRALREAGESGRRRIDLYTIGLTLLVAAFQAYGVAGGLQGVANLVAEPGPAFTVTTVLTLTAGTLFVTWLCWQITARGLGNGIALVLCLGIVLQVPGYILGVLDLGRRGVFSPNFLAGLALLALASVTLVAFIEKAQRFVRVDFAARGSAPAASADLTFKLNGAGVIPSVVAAWVLLAPLLLARYFGAEEFVRTFTPGQPLFFLAYAFVIFFCVYLYTAFLLDPNEAAQALQRHGGTIRQVPSGEATAEHLDGILSRVTLIGAIYFVAVCLIPELLILWGQVPFYFGGVSLLVLVCTVVDIEKQARELARVK
jgi:preprotein translocase subunit SecY